eukprot:TRINITY_DN16663_c0_g1_i2.p1 TRINITY_DN16663_c0_g1~~TRINITY_DN16663_c0_g1_i2.p1  ORF type:complete len:172 (-),score=7.20 TRINITY_DN16663_c0_g1_i2:540-1055(-)
MLIPTVPASGLTALQRIAMCTRCVVFWLSAGVVMAGNVANPPSVLSVGTCARGSTVADCDYFDCGSCGVAACCMLRFRVVESPADSMTLLQTSLDGVGGPDGGYSWLPDYLGVAGFRDDRARGVGLDFVGVLSHSTVEGEMQRLNIAILNEDGGGSRLDISSLSQKTTDKY